MATQSSMASKAAAVAIAAAVAVVVAAAAAATPLYRPRTLPVTLASTSAVILHRRRPRVGYQLPRLVSVRAAAETKKDSRDSRGGFKLGFILHPLLPEHES